MKLFEYELSSHPLAIANVDGSPVRTNKAQLMQDLEALADSSVDPKTLKSDKNFKKQTVHSLTIWLMFRN